MLQSNSFGITSTDIDLQVIIVSPINMSSSQFLMFKFFNLFVLQENFYFTIQ